jgi:hypothetical protein
VTFGYVAPPYGALWPQIAELLGPAMERGGNDWGELESSLGDNRSQLWLTVEERPVAAMVTRIDGDTLEIWLAGGAVLSGSLPFLETAIEASKAVGTTNGRIIGRKGWSRVLRQWGWRQQGDELVKDWS